MVKKTKKTIHNNIKNFRLKLGLTQVEFSKQFNVTQSYLSKIESGHQKPNANLLKEIYDENNDYVLLIFDY